MFLLTVRAVGEFPVLSRRLVLNEAVGNVGLHILKRQNPHLWRWITQKKLCYSPSPSTSSML